MASKCKTCSAHQQAAAPGRVSVSAQLHGLLAVRLLLVRRPAVSCPVQVSCRLGEAPTPPRAVCFTQRPLIQILISSKSSSQKHPGWCLTRCLGTLAQPSWRVSALPRGLTGQLPRKVGPSLPGGLLLLPARPAGLGPASHWHFMLFLQQPRVISRILLFSFSNEEIQIRI